MAELKQLPLTLGKLLGGIAAVVGCTMAVLTATRHSDSAPTESLLPLLIAAAGVVVFVLSGRALSRRPTAPPGELKPADRLRMNMLAWVLLLAFAGTFLAIVWYLTGE
jgi:hypothetical protein